MSAFSKERVSQLQDEVRSLRSMSPSSPSRVIVTSSPSIRASEPHFPRSIPVNIQPRFDLPPRFPTSGDGASDVSDDEEDDGNTVTTRLSTVPASERSAQLSEEEYEDAAEETVVLPQASVEDEEEGDVDEEGEILEADEDEDEPGQRERNLADREMRLAERESQRARDAFESGNKAFAKQVSVAHSCMLFASDIDSSSKKPPWTTERVLENIIAQQLQRSSTLSTRTIIPPTPAVHGWTSTDFTHAKHSSSCETTLRCVVLAKSDAARSLLEGGIIVLVVWRG